MKVSLQLSDDDEEESAARELVKNIPREHHSFEYILRELIKSKSDCVKSAHSELFGSHIARDDVSATGESDESTRSQDDDSSQISVEVSDADSDEGISIDLDDDDHDADDEGSSNFSSDDDDDSE